MKKHFMLGISNLGKEKYCCILRCLLSFDKLDVSQIEASDFQHDSTNWGGCDKLNRTIEIGKFELTGNSIHLNSPITFCGADDDMGHRYPWSFEVTDIYEIKEE